MVGETQPLDFWHHPSILEAIRAQNVGKLIHAYRHRFPRPISQEQVAHHLGYAGQDVISRIEAGRRPVKDLDRLTHICEALQVPRELWWFAPAAGVTADPSRALTYHQDLTDTLAAVADLRKGSMDRRSFLHRAAFTVAATAGPSRDWLLATLEDTAAAPGRISCAQVDAIRRTWQLFATQDWAHGGGHTRERFATYIVDEVLPLLDVNDATSPQGRALCEAAAEQLHLLAMMSFDDDRSGLAQRYLTQAMRLAHAAGAVDDGAHAVAGLALLAVEAGEYREAGQLASVGRRGLARRGSSRGCAGLLSAVEARAAAAAGDRRATTAAIAAGQRAAASMRPDDEPAWGRALDEAYLSAEWALAAAMVGDWKATHELAARSITEAGARGWPRPVVYGHTARAIIELSDDRLDVAASEASAAVHIASGLRSSRALSYARDLRTRLRPHGSRSADVRHFLADADLLLSA